MTAAERACYEELILQGVPAESLDRYLEPPPRRVDPRLARSALRRDILDARIEQATLEAHEQTRERLRRLGFNGSKLPPPIVPRPSERHLARCFEGVEPERIRRATGTVLGVR